MEIASSQCPASPLLGSQRGVETEPQPPVLPRSEIARGRSRREGEREVDQVFGLPAGVEGRVYELGPGIGFTQGHALSSLRYPIQYLTWMDIT